MQMESDPQNSATSPIQKFCHLLAGILVMLHWFRTLMMRLVWGLALVCNNFPLLLWDRDECRCKSLSLYAFGGESFVSDLCSEVAFRAWHQYGSFCCEGAHLS